LTSASPTFIMSAQSLRQRIIVLDATHVFVQGGLVRTRPPEHLSGRQDHDLVLEPQPGWHLRHHRLHHSCPRHHCVPNPRCASLTPPQFGNLVRLRRCHAPLEGLADALMFASCCIVVFAATWGRRPGPRTVLSPAMWHMRHFARACRWGWCNIWSSAISAARER